MITLTISSSLPQFTQFLLERCGIEGNILTVDEARAAARHGLLRTTFSYLPTRLPGTGQAVKSYLPTIGYLPNRAT